MKVNGRSVKSVGGGGVEHAFWPLKSYFKPLFELCDEYKLFNSQVKAFCGSLYWKLLHECVISV